MNKIKETTKSLKKLSYEKPIVEAKTIELEYSVAAGSTRLQQNWKDSKTFNEEVENNYW